MRFPPPVRFSAPVVALVFGLRATWFDYRLNLDLDLARHLSEMRTRAESSGIHLARASGALAAGGNTAALQSQVEAIPALSGVELVGIVDHDGTILADSTGTLGGRSVESTPLAPAARLANAAGGAVVREGEGPQAIVSAHPFPFGPHGDGWVLQAFDRSEAMAAAQADAHTQRSGKYWPGRSS